MSEAKKTDPSKMYQNVDIKHLLMYLISHACLPTNVKAAESL